MREILNKDGLLVGTVPDHWTVCKTLFTLAMPITDGPHTTPTLYSEGIPFVSAEAVSTGNGRINFDHIRGYVSQDFYNECCKKYVPEIDDIYMIKSGATTGKVAIVDTDKVFTIWSPLAVFRVNKKIVLPRFFYYFIQSDLYKQQVELGWNYGTQQNIGMRMLEKLYIAYPSLVEQSHIAKYIDIKCSQIDEAISRHQSIIEKLEEYRKAIITKAVTKGLNSNVEMKDSAFEWIGKIPITWDLCRLKFCLSIPLQYGANESGVLYDPNLPRYVRITDILPDGTLKNDNKLSLTDEQARSYILKNGDILLARSGATVGKSFIYKEKYGLAAFAGYLIRARTNNCLIPEYLNYITQSCYYDIWKELILTQATIQNIGADKYNQLPIPLPSKSEQNDIINYLDRQCSKVDAAIFRQKSAIEKLEEYKKSIIYNAVTGKIDCRNYKEDISSKSC